MRARRILTLGVVTTATILAPLTAAGVPSPETDASPRGGHLSGGEQLERAVTTTRERGHAGELSVITFEGDVPDVRAVSLVHDGDDGVRFELDDDRTVGRVGGEAFLGSSGTLLRLGGVQRTPHQHDQLVEKYRVERTGTAELDTGPADRLTLVDRRSGAAREALYVDRATQLLVRRETFDDIGRPVRIVAFTSLEVGDEQVRVPRERDREVTDHQLADADVTGLRGRGFVIPTTLPGGYDLLAGYAVSGAAVGTLHLVYGDGLYTLSLFEQRGELATTAVEGATRLTTDGGGAVWRWPGSEPRRVVWSGDGITFTVLTDAPTDETLRVIDRLPHDPAPTWSTRLSRGLDRVGQWLWPAVLTTDLDRSDP